LKVHYAIFLLEGIIEEILIDENDIPLCLYWFKSLKKYKGSGLNRLTENNSIIQQKNKKRKGIFDIIELK